MELSFFIALLWNNHTDTFGKYVCLDNILQALTFNSVFHGLGEGFSYYMYGAHEQPPRHLATDLKGFSFTRIHFPKGLSLETVFH